MKVKLSRGYYCIVDKFIASDILKHKWCVNIFNKIPYAVRNANGKTILMHRLIIGAKKGQIVDHINRISLDNRLKNLRISNASLNIANSRLRSDNTTGYKGVRLDKRRGLFYSSIKVNGKEKFLGYFKSSKEANKARVSAGKKWFGDHYAEK